jgi:uncharacterized protein DUF4342
MSSVTEGSKTGSAGVGLRVQGVLTQGQSVRSVHPGILTAMRFSARSETMIEEIKVSGGKLKAKLKELIREGNVRRVVIRNAKGRVLLDMPLNAGVVGAALLPFWVAVGAVVALAKDFTIMVERDTGTGITKRSDL